eukprot:15634-Heterococcus_DN1.PRE.5
MHQQRCLQRMQLVAQSLAGCSTSPENWCVAPQCSDTRAQYDVYGCILPKTSVETLAQHESCNTSMQYNHDAEQ